jgi:DNA-binding transcriptional MerR regulator
MVRLIPPASLYEGLDDMTCALVLRLQIEDINKLLDTPAKGEKRNEAGLTEWQQSLLVQKEELQRNLSVIRDKQLSQGLAFTVFRKSSNLFHSIVLVKGQLLQAPHTPDPQIRVKLRSS